MRLRDARNDEFLAPNFACSLARFCNLLRFRFELRRKRVELRELLAHLNI